NGIREMAGISQANGFVFLALLVLVGSSLFGCNRQPGPPSTRSERQDGATPTRTDEQNGLASNDEVRDWSLSEADSGSLGAPYKMSSFEIRPPASFRFIQHATEAKTYYWVGPIRADETYPQLIVLITELPAREARFPLKTLLSDSLEGIRGRRTDWSET